MEHLFTMGATLRRMVLPVGHAVTHCARLANHHRPVDQSPLLSPPATIAITTVPLAVTASGPIAVLGVNNRPVTVRLRLRLASGQIAGGGPVTTVPLASGPIAITTVPLPVTAVGGPATIVLARRCAGLAQLASARTRCARSQLDSQDSQLDSIRGAGRSRGSRAHHKGEAGALQGDVDIHWPVRDISMRDRHREKAKLLDDVYGQNRAEDKVGFVRIQPIPVRRQRVVGLAHRRSPATKPQAGLGLQLMPHLHPNWNPRGVEGTGRRSHFQRYNSCAIEATNIGDFRLNLPLRTDTKRESEVMPCYVICLNDLKCHCINLSL